MQVQISYKKKAIKLDRYMRGKPKNMAKGIRRVALHMERAFKKTLKDSNPTTFFYKSHRWNLASRTGNLRRSITSRIRPTSALVGPGGLAARYARIHETGGRIPVTDKMRRYLHSRGIHLKKSTTEIEIPQRQWFEPTIRREHRKVVDLMRDSLNRPLK